MSNLQTATAIAYLCAIAMLGVVGLYLQVWGPAIGGAVGLAAVGVLFSGLHDIIEQLRETNRYLWRTEQARDKAGKS